MPKRIKRKIDYDFYKSLLDKDKFYYFFQFSYKLPNKKYINKGIVKNIRTSQFSNFIRRF